MPPAPFFLGHCEFVSSPFLATVIPFRSKLTPEAQTQRDGEYNLCTVMLAQLHKTEGCGCVTTTTI